MNSCAEDECEAEADQETGDQEESHQQSWVLSLVQDLIYSVSEGKRWTPKHVGLGSTLHQTTRSKQLVQLFHKAGHIISYRDILRLDTTLAKTTLASMDSESGTTIPPNLNEGRFIHFSADSIDINESTLDGKNTFHATQNPHGREHHVNQ